MQCNGPDHSYINNISLARIILIHDDVIADDVIITYSFNKIQYFPKKMYFRLKFAKVGLIANKLQDAIF